MMHNVCTMKSYLGRKERCNKIIALVLFTPKWYVSFQLLIPAAFSDCSFVMAVLASGTVEFAVKRTAADLKLPQSLPLTLLV